MRFHRHVAARQSAENGFAGRQLQPHIGRAQVLVTFGQQVNHLGPEERPDQRVKFPAQVMHLCAKVGKRDASLLKRPQRFGNLPPIPAGYGAFVGRSGILINSGGHPTGGAEISKLLGFVCSLCKRMIRAGQKVRR